MKMKKLIALLTAATMVFGTVACGNGGTSDENGGDEAGSKLDWTKGATASGGDVTLRVATWRTSDKPYYEEIIKRFEEKYDWIDVELEITGDSNSYYTNLQADIMSGTAPDVFDMHSNTTILSYVEAGSLAPQTDFDYMKNYNEVAKSITTLNGENYGYMNAYNYFGFLYNKAIFEKVGVTVPTTPEEFIDVMNKLKAAGYGGVAYPGKTVNDRIIEGTLLCSLGAEGYESFMKGIDDGSITDISEVDGVAKAFDTIQYYMDNDLFYTAWEGITYEAGMSLYAQEKTAVAYSGTYIFGEKEKYFPNIDTGFFAIPTYANSGLSYAEGAQCACINSAGNNLGAAKLWVEFLATPEISEYFCSNSRMLSTLNGVTPKFDEAEMIVNSCTGYAARQIVEFEHDEYWQTGYNSVLEGLMKGNEWENMVKVFTSKLEEYDLANQ